MPEPTALQSSMLSEQELYSIQTFYRAFTDHNPDLLDQVCAPNWQDIPLAPGQGSGPNGLKGQITSVFLSAFPDLKIVVHEIFGSPGRAGVRASITGTHLGEVMGVAPTARRSTLRCTNSITSKTANLPIPGTLKIGSACSTGWVSGIRQLRLSSSSS